VPLINSAKRGGTARGEGKMSIEAKQIADTRARFIELRRERDDLLDAMAEIAACLDGLGDETDPDDFITQARAIARRYE
jgi:hypothetical protein